MFGLRMILGSVLWSRSKYSPGPLHKWPIISWPANILLMVLPLASHHASLGRAQNRKYRILVRLLASQQPPCQKFGFHFQQHSLNQSPESRHSPNIFQINLGTPDRARWAICLFVLFQIDEHRRAEWDEMRIGAWASWIYKHTNTQALFLSPTLGGFPWCPAPAVQCPGQIVEVSIWHQGPGKSFKCPSRCVDLSNIKHLE